ncbi:hypothetical protein VTG60DRAFT_6144 [Thermothelomyces hinnuleus]
MNEASGHLTPSQTDHFLADFFVLISCPKDSSTTSSRDCSDLNQKHRVPVMAKRDQEASPSGTSLKLTFVFSCHTDNLGCRCLTLAKAIYDTPVHVSHRSTARRHWPKALWPPPTYSSSKPLQWTPSSSRNICILPTMSNGAEENCQNGAGKFLNLGRPGGSISVPVCSDSEYGERKDISPK